MELNQTNRPPHPVLNVPFARYQTTPGIQRFTRLLGESVTIERHRTTGEQSIDHVGHIARIMPVKAGVLTSPTLV